MVFCTYCGQSFTRDEHLERHILTHTNVKPFKCFTCHMSFARRDLLQRHYTVHGRDQNNQEGIPINNTMIKPAGRTPIACSNCARTKTKCDKKFPCSRCAGRNLRCTLRPHRRSKTVNARPQVPADGTSGTSTESGNQPSPSGSSGSPPPQQSQAPASSTITATAPTPIPQSQASLQAETPALQNPTPPDEKATLDPSFFDQSPPMANAHLLSASMSPLSGTVSVNAFMQNTPMSGYGDFMRSGRDGSDHAASPPFLMDWAQMHISAGFEPMGRPDLMMGADIGFDLNAMTTGSHSDGITALIPDLTHPLPGVQTPLATPRLEGVFPEVDLGGPGSVFYPSSRNTSVSDSAVPDLGAIIAAQDAWSAFRCTPTVPSSSCPKTARLNLEKLEQSLKNHEEWSRWKPTWDDADFAGGDHLQVTPLQESTRDKLFAITQAFLHKALDIHKNDLTGTPTGGASPNPSGSNFVLLPPARVLEAFMRAYANSFERFFPITGRGALDANALLESSNDKAASLLILLIIAQGATSMSSSEARWLTGGLTEACRISLFDLIEKNINMACDPVVLRSGLLFIVQAGWSGDKWQMDIAMGQRGMYSAMVRHSGSLEPRKASLSDHRGMPEVMWCDWVEQENCNRLVYSWAMVDQDLSLFRDIAPLFSITEFGAPMPDVDRLWQAKTAAEWASVFEQVYPMAGGYAAGTPGSRPISLRDLFSLFLDDDILAQNVQLTPLHLRLLLHPLQCLVYQFCQLLSCFSENGNARRPARAVSAQSTRARMEEVQTLLQRWYDLADRHLKSNPMCPMMQAALVIFHLISLNAVTNFPEIERLARRENCDGTYPQLMWVHKRCIRDVEEAIFHCGQVLRLVRSMPRAARPPWWAAAVYRVSLILWTDSLAHKDSVSPSASGMFPVPGPSFAIDSLPPDHPLVVRYLTKREGLPTLTKRDGSQFPMENPFSVLSHCVDVIDEGIATRFSDGIRGKLERLARS